MRTLNLAMNVFMKLSMVILGWTQRLSIFIGNNIIAILEKLEVPIIEILNEYLSLPTDKLTSIVGFAGLFLSFLIIKAIRRRFIRTSHTTKNIQRRVSDSHNYG